MPSSGLHGLRASASKMLVYLQATAVLQGLKINIELQTLLQPVAKVIETLPYFGLNDLPMIHPPPLMKDSSNTRPCSKYRRTALNRG